MRLRIILGILSYFYITSILLVYLFTYLYFSIFYINLNHYMNFYSQDNNSSMDLSYQDYHAYIQHLLHKNLQELKPSFHQFKYAKIISNTYSNIFYEIHPHHNRPISHTYLFTCYRTSFELMDPGHIYLYNNRHIHRNQ